VFERFTEEARQVIVLAQSEARGLGHTEIGTEHLLLGLIGEGAGPASRAFAKLGVTMDAAREQVAADMPPSDEAPRRRQLPFTSRAKGTLEAALRQALGLGEDYIGTEHMLLALLIERDARTASVLASLGLPPSLLRSTVMDERTVKATPDPHDDGDALLTLAEGSGVAGRALVALGVTRDALREAIEQARAPS
jgi:ATP-dependent Clp protease ATP-binding subunit ClpC